jgi:hypothetical protein
MSSADVLRRAFRGLEVNGDFSEAVVVFDDDSRLDFRHRVGERTVQATGAGDATVAAETLARIVLFRLNARHLDVQFSDGSRWETLFAQ